MEGRVPDVPRLGVEELHVHGDVAVRAVFLRADGGRAHAHVLRDLPVPGDERHLSAQDLGEPGAEVSSDGSERSDHRSPSAWTFAERMGEGVLWRS
jgi:hypothetical protein